MLAVTGAQLVLNVVGTRLLVLTGCWPCVLPLVASSVLSREEASAEEALAEMAALALLDDAMQPGSSIAWISL
jgi:hypothetical protein